ncbi:hypothetical protein [Bradyrhizobium sp. AZCC 2289]|uniref:hypothetical protein n=1 Tax=Bradyrhizobium sp. AZCC 2289 TaxID=3117026 RepID=UPI00303A5CC5
MALHRDIHWIGRQWAVTGHGMQLIDQKLKGFFDIEAARLWDDGLIESMRAKEWLNTADFDKGLAIARARYPQSPGNVTPPPEEKIVAAPVIAPAAAPAQALQSEEPKARAVDPIASIPTIAEIRTPEPLARQPDEPPKAAAPKFHVQFLGSARFVRPWRVLVKR